MADQQASSSTITADADAAAAAAEAAAVAEEVRAVAAAVDADEGGGGAFAGERLDDMTNIDIIRWVAVVQSEVHAYGACKLSTHAVDMRADLDARPPLLA